MKLIKFCGINILLYFISILPCFLMLKSCKTVIFGSFNMQIFGITKYNRNEAMVYMKMILTRYDVIFLQEIREKRHNNDLISIEKVLMEINHEDEFGSQYKIILSKRLGRSNSKEVYAYIYNNKIVSISSYGTLIDKSDEFEREPFIANIKIDESMEVSLVGIHIKPDDALNEMNYLHNSIEKYKKFLSPNIIILGDFNADCTYMSSDDWKNVKFKQDNNYTWLINDNEDTTVNENTHCAYDRIIVTNTFNVKMASVFNFEREYQISNELIIERYDILLLQEIREKQGNGLISIEKLIIEMNRNNADQYGLYLSKEIGRTRSKEAYAFVYKKDIFKLENAKIHNDVNDKFEREPIIAVFSLIEVPYVINLIGIHIKPDDVINEINELYNIIESENLIYDKNTIILGDLNADCKYLKSKDWADVKIYHDKSYKWLISSNEDTTVSDSTFCAYDRIIVSLPIKIDYYNIYNFQKEFDLDIDKAKAISDHYPVEVAVKLDECLIGKLKCN
ncbi:DNase I [Intoshia linei]|uniref:DNase I n=1 Tax=Intoshia linei TaxID=1819745 RepID=A0A177B2P2_9BILA|nr:DNase I [Intoshia linei]